MFWKVLKTEIFIFFSFTAFRSLLNYGNLLFMCMYLVYTFLHLMASAGGWIYLCNSNNAFYNGEPGKEAMVYAIFQISSHLSNSHGWMLVSFADFVVIDFDSLGL